MDVFFSYRRESGIELTRNLKTELEKLGYTVFFDTESLREGLFNEQLIKNIEEADNFVLVLTKNALDRCVEKDDWVRKEIEAAIEWKKNIIPIICEGFRTPEGIPESVRQASLYQGVTYSPMQFDTVVKTLVRYLKDRNGHPLHITKKQNTSNTYYGDGHMTENERQRIRLDFKVVRKIEKRIWDELLQDRDEGLVLFAPAVYDVKTYMGKYQRREIKHIYGLVNASDEAEEANRLFGNDQSNRFYVGNMENDNFEQQMDMILDENGIEGFDFVDLTLILRDLKAPGEKLKQIVERMNPDGIVYVREFDHGMVQAYPDDDKRFENMMRLINYDKYSGDFYAGRKVYSMMRDAYLEDIALANECITTIGMSRRDKDDLFEALFSYVPREYAFLEENERHNVKYHDGAMWLKENYDNMKRDFRNDDFFYRTGHVFMYGFKR